MLFWQGRFRLKWIALRALKICYKELTGISMEILGIGIAELFFIVLLILILFGKKDMENTGKTLGGWLNRLVNSPTYKLLTRTGSELKNVPRNLMREANLEKFEEEIKSIGGDVAKKAAPFLNDRDIFGQSIGHPGPAPAAEKKKPEQEISTPKLPGEDF